MLARLRLGPANLRGRQFPEPSHPFRNDFQRDRDRIIHSRAFRRLEGKTQVFATGLCDHFRNRLTHSVEVAQVARTVCSALELNEEYTEALALAHDLGHPPFAHVGERELDRQMHRFGSSFEHNRHALRIIDHLERRYARFDGLIFRWHEEARLFLPADAEPDVQDLLPGERPPLEAQIIDLADEIAYNTADIDDSFSTGLFSMEQIGESIPIFSKLAETAETQFPGAPEHIRFWEIQRHLMNELVSGLVQGTAEAANAAGVESVADVRALHYRLARMTPEAHEINSQMRSLLVNRVYSYAQLIEDRSAAVDKLRLLFEYFLEHPERMASGHRERLEEAPVHRVVCDYVAGMTDSYLLRLYKDLVQHA